MSDDRQRQRHGVSKKLVEGAGGFLVGAAAVLLLRGLWRARSKPAAPLVVNERNPESAPASTTSAEPAQASPAPTPRRRRKTPSATSPQEQTP